MKGSIFSSWPSTAWISSAALEWIECCAISLRLHLLFSAGNLKRWRVGWQTISFSLKIFPSLPLRLPQSKRTAVGESLAEMEKRHIAAVLEHTDGNVTRTAEILKVDRVTVYNKIKKYGLRVPLE